MLLVSLFVCVILGFCNLIYYFVAYCVVAVESVGRQLPIAFLERVKEDFTKRYGGGKATTAAAKSLNKDFGYLCLLLCYAQ